MKKLFVLLYFSMTKSTKSHLRGLSSLLKIFFRVHEFVARAMRGECVWQMAKRKSAALRSPQSHTTTRANISHESRADSCTHCLHARWIMCRGRGEGKCVDVIEYIFLLFLLAVLGLYLVGELTHMRSMCVGVAETGVAHLSSLEKQSKSATIGCRLAL